LVFIFLLKIIYKDKNNIKAQNEIIDIKFAKLIPSKTTFTDKVPLGGKLAIRNPKT
jgi:hypothetical protein